LIVEKNHCLVIDPFVIFTGCFRVVAVSMNSHFLLTFSRAGK